MADVFLIQMLLLNIGFFQGNGQIFLSSFRLTQSTMNFRWVLSFFFLGGPLLLHGQVDYTWWNEKHHWDGTTPWLQYIRAVPRYMGPNALPVPEIRDGRTGDSLSIRIDMDAYLSKGDQTQNLNGRLVIPVVREKVMLEFFGIPVEHYMTDTLVRDERCSREYDGKGWSAGDFYFGTVIQLVKNRGRWPDLTLGLTCKTASGENVEGARMTDGAGYYFDLGVGKDISPFMRFHGMIGFYAWQTTDVESRQDDAFLYGMGATFHKGSFFWQHDVSGFTGYQGNGDDPIVYRTTIGTRMGRATLGLNYLAGLYSFPFQRIRLSVTLDLRGRK
jgi:hypothetical protein